MKPHTPGVRHYAFSAMLATILFYPPVLPAESGATSALMQRGAQLSAIADELEVDAGTYIQRGGEIRKAVERARVGQHRQPDSNPLFADLIRDHAAQISHWQTQGSQLRQRATQIRTHAVALLAQGMVKKWQPWITTTGPLEALGGEVATAHNVQIRSVQPGNPTRGAALKQRDDMSLEISALAGQQVPPALDTSSFSVSRERLFFAHIEVQPDGSNTPGGSNTKVPLNKLHSWRLVLSSLEGEAVSGANITFGGHMPGHVHGLPTQPQITTELAPGVYQVDGVKFQMSGWWVIDFAVAVNATTDNIRFNLML